ncbi:Gfo/Idh/MocA family protein [Natronobiforma cellulositropha]|uniref:Gfo/Idh/MocA family protein n=1 Tax=Natronobiforma cellulositropha TaxID=1679076 RepID=UPI0021D5A293|nr:Gfo/Idh/MocA family oxidoreductase [Natronobiforma cellulositropha]
MDHATLGIVGTGAISDRYVQAGQIYDELEVVACADIDTERARETAAEYDIEAMSVDELFAADEVDIVLNLTPPTAHAEVTLEALEAGKHVYTEKPLAVSSAAGQEILETAREHDCLVGSAPDTFLGKSFQTCRTLLEEGAIGEPIGALAVWGSPGHESWHPSPAFYYGEGGGPLFDMGPYYVTALVSLLGPIARVAGTVSTPRTQREITSEPHAGELIDVEVPTHESGLLTFENGATATVQTSFDVPASRLGGFELYGTEGTISLPDPNRFDDPVYVHTAETPRGEWELVDPTHDHPGNRGLGVVDMAYALAGDWDLRASGALAGHVLEALEAVRTSSETGAYRDLETTCARPEPLPRTFLS